MLKTISTTEWLMYEKDENGKPGPFSKRNGTGVFGDDAQKTGIPVEVWRYYLLSTRPEMSDSTFLWSDIVARNNNELLNNLGNLLNRVLPFIAKQYDGVVPEYKGALHEDDAKFIAAQNEKFTNFVQMMEDVKIKDSLKMAMTYSKGCNTHLQDTEFFKLLKTDKPRCS